MIRYDCFKKDGARYSTAPFRSCTDPSRVFASLSADLMNRYVYHVPNVRVSRRRCPYCDFFDEITVTYRLPSGNSSRTVYTVPRS